MKKHSSKKKALLIALAVIVVLILGAVGAVYGVTHGFYRSSNYTSDEDAMKDFTNVGEDTTAEDEVNPEDATGEVLSDEEQQELDAKLAEFADSEPVTNDGNVYNVLLVGVDRRDKSWAGNSDSMILMSLNYEKKQISMISLMRDTYVNIPGIGMRKLNAAHANGAGPLLLETVTQNYKVQVDRYVSVDFNSMIDIIDKLGGVELTLSDDEVRVANNYITEMCNLRKLDPNSYYFIKGGTKTCSGIQAVAYARIRYVGNADYQRTERQRTVLTKMMEKIKDMSLPELYSFAEDVLPLVTHNIPEDEMWSLLAKSPSLLQYKLVKDRIPYDNMYKVIYVKKQDMLVPDWEQTIAKLKETNEIYIITARNEDGLPPESYGHMQEMVVNWLKHQNIAYDKIIFTKGSKLPYCLENNIDVMIEDSPRNILDISSKVPVLCFDNQYNEKMDGENITRVYSWYDILKKLEK